MTDPAATPPDAPPAADLLEAARAFFPEFVDARLVAGRSHLLMAETPAGRRVVRRWPADAPAARVEATLALLGRLAGAGMPVPSPRDLPGGGAVLRLGRDRFDARSWLPGSPVGRAAVAYPDPDRWLGLPVALPERAFADAIRGLARLHQETSASVGPRFWRCRPPRWPRCRAWCRPPGWRPAPRFGRSPRGRRRSSAGSPPVSGCCRRPRPSSPPPTRRCWPPRPSSTGTPGRATSWSGRATR
jgi:hypothetical protein